MAGIFSFFSLPDTLNCSLTNALPARTTEFPLPFIFLFSSTFFSWEREVLLLLLPPDIIFFACLGSTPPACGQGEELLFFLWEIFRENPGLPYFFLGILLNFL